MNPTTIYRLTIKIIGLFLLKAVIENTPYLLSQLYQTFIGSDTRPQIEIVGSLFWVLVFFAIIFGAAYLALFKTDFLMKKMRLDEDTLIGNPLLETDHLQNEHARAMVSISPKQVWLMAILIIAAILMIEQIPVFAQQVYFFIKARTDSFQDQRSSLIDVVVPGVKVMLAFLLFGERHKLVKWLEKTI